MNCAPDDKMFYSIHSLLLPGVAILLLILLHGCGVSNPPKLSTAHLQPVKPVNKDIPSTTRLPVLPRPKQAPKLDTYTVVVNEVPVKELLFSVARDAKINVDIHSGITGVVTLNAVNQTLPQILTRISKQVDLRYELDGQNLVITPDLAYWRLYPVDYVNLSRDSSSEVNVATEIATTGGTVAGGGSAGGSGNKSNTNIKNISNNHFWDLLTKNIITIIGSEKGISNKGARNKGTDNPSNLVDQAQAVMSNDKSVAVETNTNKEKESEVDNSKTTAVVVNPVAGVINVRATQRQHQQVQAFLDKVMVNAQRQVLIEMTIVEVELSDNYQAGVDWSRLPITGGGGPSIDANMLGTSLSTPPSITLGYSNALSSVGNVSATLKLLEAFGNVKVLSSPKIMALNNQTAILKVVDETVYFTVEQETTIDNGIANTVYTSEVHTVPVGLLMSVMPQINENEIVTLNIRPTISRITSFKEDPVPKLSGVNFENLVPQIQVREMESLLQVSDGQTVVMGGLMQNKIQKDRNGIPVLSDAPYVGDLFSYKNELITKTELVIFLKPTIIKNGGINTDFTQYNHFLTDDIRSEANVDY